MPVPSVDWNQVDVTAGEVLKAEQARIDGLLAMGDPGEDELAQAYGSAGMHYHAFGLSSAAEACYINASRLAPSDFRWPYYLGHLYGDGEALVGDLGMAAMQYVNALAVKPGHLPSLVALGKVYLTLGRLDEARAAYAAVGDVDPENAAANLGLGRILMALGEHDQALSFLERADRSQPNVRTIHYALAITYRALGETDKAREHLERGEKPAVRVDDELMGELRSVRSGAPSLIHLGTALMNANRVEEALQAFSRAVDLDPESASAWLNLGVTRLLLEDFSGAVRELSRAVELAPANSTGHYNLGVAYALRGLESSAIRHLSAAVALRPGYARAQQQLGDALARERQYKRALSHYERSVELSPGEFLPRFRQAMMLVQLGRSVSAVRELDLAVRGFPGSEDGRNALARVLATSLEPSLRNPIRALEIAQRLPRHAREFAHTATLAMAYAAVGDYGLALQHGEVALKRARQLGTPSQVNHLEALSRRYREGKTYAVPWARDDPIFHPSVI